MEARYYIPEKEEFHIGFEYEVFEKGEPSSPGWMSFMPQQEKDVWYKFKFPDPFLGYKLDSLYKKPLRVKYLDREDMESLGFIITGEEIKSYGHYLSGFIKHDNYKTEFYYSFLTSNDYIHLVLRNSHYNGNAKFSIRNKSEVTKLLKQQNIMK